MTEHALLAVRELTLAYGHKVVVSGVDLEVGQGEIVTLLGHNGAGKSSLLSGILGQLRPTAGRIQFDGEDVTTRPIHQRLDMGIALVPQGHQVFGSLRVIDNLRLAGRRSDDDALDTVFELFPILKDRTMQRAGTLSGGQQQMLAVGMGLALRPRVLLVDEPSIGLAPTLVDDVMGALVRIVEERQCSVLLVEQSVDKALAISNRAYGMRRAEIVAHAPASEFTSEYDLMEIM